MNIVKPFLSIAAVIALAAPASATIYTYRQANNNVLTINTVTGAGTLVGTGINVSFTSAALRGFTGGAAPVGTFAIDTIQGTRVVSGRTTTAVDVNRETLTFAANGSTSLWFQSQTSGGRAVNNDVISTTVQYTPPLTTSSTGGSTGGTSTGGTSTGGTSTGGTSTGGTSTGGTSTGGTSTGGTSTGGTSTGGTSTGGTSTGGTSTGGTTSGSSGSTSVPEPGMLALFALGAGGLAWRRRRAAKQK